MIRKLLAFFMKMWSPKPVVKPADWGQTPTKFWTFRFDGDVVTHVSLDNAIEAAHCAAVCSNEWPRGVNVWDDHEKLVFGYCPYCEYCTHRDDQQRCRPCQAAKSVTSDPLNVKFLSRQYTESAHPRWTKPEAEDVVPLSTTVLMTVRQELQWLLSRIEKREDLTTFKQAGYAALAEFEAGLHTHSLLGRLRELVEKGRQHVQQQEEAQVRPEGQPQATPGTT